MQNNSSAAFPTTALSGDTMSLALAAVAALNACASGQFEQTSIDIDSFVQWLSNSETVRKYISGQSVLGIEPPSMQNKPTLSVPFISLKPDQLNLNTSNHCVLADVGVVTSKLNAWISSLPSQIQDMIHVDLLVRLLQNPEDIEKLSKEYDSSERCGNLSASMLIKAAADQKLHAIATAPESSCSFPRANTINEHNSPSITGVASAPRKIFSSVGTASNNISLTEEDIPLPEATMAPMSPLYSSPSANWESDMKTERIINEYGTFADMRMEPRCRKSLISPVFSLSLPQTELLELPRASLQPTTNGLSLLPHRNPPLPEMHLAPVSGVIDQIPIPRTKLVTALGPDPSLRTDLVTSPKASRQPAAIMRHLPSAFGHSAPLVNPSSFGDSSQVVERGPTMLKPEKLCINFNTPMGCRNGAKCRYLHSKSDQTSPSRVEALPNAKRMKLGSETSGSW